MLQAEAELFWDPDLTDQASFPMAFVGLASLWGCGGFASGEDCGSGEGCDEENDGKNGCAFGSLCSGLSPKR